MVATVAKMATDKAGSPLARRASTRSPASTDTTTEQAPDGTGGSTYGGSAAPAPESTE